MIIPDRDWTTEYVGVIHKVHEGVQYTITKYGESFVDLGIYSWYTHTRETYTFFVNDFQEVNSLNETFFWGCGSIERAVELAKEFVSEKSNRNRFDMIKKRFNLHDVTLFQEM